MRKMNLGIAAALLGAALATQAHAQTDFCGAGLAVGLGATPFNNTGFGNEGRSPVPADCAVAGNAPAGDTYFTFTASVAGPYVFSTCGPTTGDIVDTIIEVYSDCAAVEAGTTVLGCNDDSPGTDCGPFGYLSRVTVPLAASQTVVVRVMGWNAVEIGTGTLYISFAPPPPANDTCATATTVSVGSTPFDSTSASDDANTSCGLNGTLGGVGRDVFFRFTPPTSETYTLATCGGGFDTIIEVFEGSCGALSSIGCNDDLCGRLSSIPLALTAGVPYIIQVDGWDFGEGGPASLHIGIAPTNDFCVTPPPIAPLGTTPFNTTLAADDGGTAACGGSGPDIFFRFIPPSDGTYTIDTCGSAFDTAIALNSDCFTEITCNDDSPTACAGTFQSEIVSALTGGIEYIIRIDGFGGASGTGVLNITAGGGGPTCDSIDFNNDGLFPDTLDIDDFLSVFSGGPCSNDPLCGDIDFNNDGLFPDTLDVDSLLSVFSGGPCL